MWSEKIAFFALRIIILFFFFYKLNYKLQVMLNLASCSL